MEREGDAESWQGWKLGFGDWCVPDTNSGSDLEVAFRHVIPPSKCPTLNSAF